MRVVMNELCSNAAASRIIVLRICPAPLISQ